MWKTYIEGMSNKSANHPAWGADHCRRVYEQAMLLADGEPVDGEALYVAALLHDFGAYQDYAQEGVDHAERSAELSGEILKNTDFPSDKRDLVKRIIQGHMFYTSPEEVLEAKIFHDADVLDFMGYLGIARLLSIVGKEKLTPNLRAVIDLIKNFEKELPKALVTANGKDIGMKRSDEMKSFLEGIREATFREKYV